MKKASVTVFMGMNLLLLLSVFFSLLEVVHYYVLNQDMALVAAVSLESAFADYNRPLWDDYGILAIDASYGTGEADFAKMSERMKGYLEENAGVYAADGSDASLIRMRNGDVAITAYGLLTDNGGTPFIRQAAKTALYESVGDVKDALLEEAAGAEDLLRDAEEVEGLLDSGGDALEGRADDSLPEISDKEKDELMGTDPLSAEEAASIGNPIKTMSEARDKGWLGLVLPQEATVSEAVFAGERVSQRQLAKGELAGAENVSAAEKLLFLRYLNNHFSNFTKKNGGEGLCYELEYMVAGKDSDAANLKEVVEILIALREAANFASLTSDPVKMAKADATAVTLVGWTLNPLLVSGTKWGIVAAWALGESVLDVRGLLQGKRIPLIKSTEEWTLSLGSLASAINGNMSAKESETGLSYPMYLYARLLLSDDKTLGLRGLDILEEAVTHEEDYVNVRADQMVYCLEADMSCDAAPLFLSFVAVENNVGGGYHFTHHAQMSYIDE